ncbi:MAG: SLC13/DASS family transporter [Alphaproteobacteria bacterium]|nr:SLC13/DASS family transporter [Alphaproteobacteria bacterium]
MSSARPAWWIALAFACAFALAAIAPAPWPSGPAWLAITGPDGAVRFPVELGVDGVVEAQDGAWHARWTQRDGAIAIDVENGEAPLQLGDIRIGIELTDGRDALIPAVHARDGVLHAERRLPVRSALVLGLLGLVVVLWLSETLPLWVTSIGIPVVLVAGGMATASGALAPFFHPIIALFLAGFALADALSQAGLDRRVALALVAGAGGHPARLFAAMLALSALLSMFMSNTAAAAMLVPMAIAVSQPLGERGAGFRRASVLGIAYAATLGGVGSAIGTPANPLAIEFLARSGRDVGFVGWFLYGLPMVALFLPVIGLWVWWWFGAAASGGFELGAASGDPLPPLTRRERRVSAVFVLVVLGWLTESLHGVHPGLVGLGGVVLLNALGCFDTAGLGRLDWGALLTFGGGLTLGATLSDTGTADWIATRLESFAALPPMAGVVAVGVLALVLTAVASNTASAAILIPLAIPLASVLGVDPVLLVMVVTIASSIDFALVIGTPPTMVAYSTGEVTAGEIFRVGIALDLLGLAVLLTAVVGWWTLLGLV